MAAVLDCIISHEEGQGGAMSIRQLSDKDLRSLVKWGSPTYADQAKQELKRREEEDGHPPQRSVPTTVPATAQGGRW